MLFKRKQIQADIAGEVGGFFDRWRSRRMGRDEAADEKAGLASGLLLKVAPAIFAAGKRLVAKFRKIPVARDIPDAELQDRALVVAEGRVDRLAEGLVEGTWGRATALRDRLVELGGTVGAARADEIAPATLGSLAELQKRLEWEFSPERSALIGITETTAAQTGGERVAADAFAVRGVILEPFWVTADEPCKICSPLNGLQQSDWPLEYQAGPPAHPRCVCALLWRSEADTIPDEDDE